MGDEPETNGFGSHEFMDLVEQIGAKAFLSVNSPEGSPAEAQSWLHYLTDPASSGAGAERARNGREQPYAVPYIGIGNENWGCGGNMTSAYYADQYRQYLSVLKPGTLIATDANADDYAWTENPLQRASTATARGCASRPWRGSTKAAARHDVAALLHLLRATTGAAKEPGGGLHRGDWATSMLRTHKMDEADHPARGHHGSPDPERRVGLSVSGGAPGGRRTRSRRPTCSRSGRCATPSSPASR